MIANPYPSQTDIGNVIASAKAAGQVRGSAFYVWNPYLSVNGAFMPVTIGSPYVIEANSSFQVRAMADSAVLHFAETNKSNGTYTALLKQQPQYLSLYIYDSSYHLWDMSYIKYSDAATDGEDNDMDAGKAVNTDLNFYSLSAEGQKLAIDARPYSEKRVIPLGITTAAQQQYIIKVDNCKVPEGAQVYLLARDRHGVGGFALQVAARVEESAGRLGQPGATAQGGQAGGKLVGGPGWLRHAGSRTTRRHHAGRRPPCPHAA